MNATSLYVSTCRLVLQANPEDPGCWADLYRLIPYLRQSLSCTVCGNLLIEPYTPTETNCQHHVCRSCKGGKKKLKPSCSWCKNYEKYVENVQLRILLQCYKKLCEYIINSSIYRLMCKTTASGDTNIANMTDLIQEGAGFKDEFKSNSGLSKSAYSILPCIYASASTQTIAQAINLNNESELGIDEDVSVAKSNLSNGSSIYSVTYAGSGNKMVIKRKAMLNKGEIENCENLRLIKGSNFKRPMHRRGNIRGRGRGFKAEENTNNTATSNCTVSSNNVNSGRMNVKKKKLGCRCGNATASPGKLTCCGQRCPCYVDSKACLDCKCRGCRNPHTKEGQKVIRDPMDSPNNKLQSAAQLQTDEGIPAKGTANNRSESRPSFNREKKNSDSNEFESVSMKPQKEITITVESIENMGEIKVNEVMVKIDFLGNTLNQSLPATITEKRADIELTAVIVVEEKNFQFMDDLLANPVLVTVLDCTGHGSVLMGISTSSPKFEKETKKKPKAVNSPISGSKPFDVNYSVLGICNLDIGPLVCGERRMRQTLLLEPDKKVSPPDVVPWVKLPKLVVTASTGNEFLIPEMINKYNNFVGITVESVYNMPEHTTEGATFDATIMMPSLGDKSRRIRFPNGVVTSVKDFVCRKKWSTLGHIEGRGGRTNYSISPSVCDVISTLPEKVNLEKETRRAPRMIQWNMWRNCLMLRNDVGHFNSKIIKYQTWPIEIIAVGKSKEQLPKEKSTKSEKKSKPVTSAVVETVDHFVAYLNLAPLLYPGVSKVRVAAQLFTYSQTDLKNKFGDEFVDLQPPTSAANLKTKAPSVKSKISAFDIEEVKDSSGVPVFNEEGSFTFIIVEVELLKPLTLKRQPEMLEAELKAHLSLKGKIDKKTSSLAHKKESFARAVMDSVSILVQEFNDFSTLLPERKKHQSDLENDFENFLLNRENFFKIRTSLEDTVISLINEKYGNVKNFEDMIPEILVFLVAEMHKATNRCLVGQEDFRGHHFNNDEVQLYAEEAYEEGEYELAKDYILLKLSRQSANPDYWIDCAVYCNSLNKYEVAAEAVKEALCLDFHHQIALLMYALLMGNAKNAILAEITFNILLTKYPDFIEGWIALSLFYSTIGNIEGSMVAQQRAKILKEEKLEPEDEREEIVGEQDELPEDRNEMFCKKYPHDDRYDSATDGKYGAASFKNGISWTEPLSWTVSFCPPDNIYIRTTVLLLKLGFYEYAMMTLAQELIFYEKRNVPPHYNYYIAVNYYLQGRYEETVPLLQNFVKKYGKDCFLWSLMGHCYYRLENHPKAIACYEYVMESYNRPDDLHLIFFRMGMYYLQANKFSCAKRVFKIACKYSPTPRLWKGLGTACLRLEEYEDADTAFTEANYLDSKDPETWAYLAIVNAMSRRLDLFKLCYIEAKKRNLKNLGIIREVKACALINGLREEDFQL